MSSEGIVSIVGPEGTPLSFPLADAFSRFGAFFIDLAILVMVNAIALCGFAFTFTLGSSLLMALGIVLLFAMRNGYFLFFETFWQGATPGKRSVGLRVVSRDGGRLRIEAVVARNLMRDLELFVPLVIVLAPQAVIGTAPWWVRLVAGLWIFVIGAMPFYTKERTRAGDLVGGTVVVTIPRAVRLRDETHAVSTSLAFSRDQLAVYGEHELETLAELLRSVDHGRAQPEDLKLVAKTIQKRIRFEGTEPERAPLVFLREFYRSQRSELENKLVLGKRKASKHDVASK